MHARSGLSEAVIRHPESRRLLEVRAPVLSSCVEINMAPPQLWSISASPWSVRAKWVLNHARVEYRNIEYNHFLVWVLRWRLWRWRITLPIMFTGETAPLLESFDIAAYGDERRTDGVESIMVDGVREWEDIAQVIMQAERCAQLMRCCTWQGCVSLVLGQLLRPSLLAHVAARLHPRFVSLW